MNTLTRTTLSRLLVFTAAVSLLLGACSKPSDATPTLDPVMIQTQAVATFSIGLTQTALAMPTATYTLTPSPSPTATTTPTILPTTAVVILPTTSCNVLTFVSDISIPDNTKMTPGQTFTKTWRVKNSGTCSWEADFQVKFFSGNAMGGKTLTLGKTIKPGESTDISIAMTAPTATGAYTGNWRMADDTGAFFGDSFYVMIQVADSSSTQTTQTSPSATPTQTATPTETTVP